ncbi:hypothetical protein ABPG77_003350 [Micractinium sp. CCAP 211/92]
MTADAVQAAPAQGSEEAQPGLPQKVQHAKRASMEEVFEHRWRKAYEATSRRGSCELLPSSASPSPDKVPSLACKPQLPAAVGVHAKAGSTAAEALSKLSLRGGGTKDVAVEAAAHGADTVPGQPSAEQRREQEIVDDDFEDVPPVSPAGTAGPAGTGNEHPATAAQQPGSPRQGEADDEEPEPEVRLVWDSSSRERGAASAAQPRPGGASVVHAQAAQLKEQGNAHMKSGQFAEAALRYSQALVACSTALQASGGGSSSAQGGAAQPRPQQGGVAAPPLGGEAAGEGPPAADAAELAAAETGAADHRFLATLHSNRAHALLKLQRFKEAAADAAAAQRLHPSWPKPLYRLAQARAALGQWSAAVAACKQGHELSPKNSEGHTEFTPLWDWVAVLAARAGSLVGFDGQQLEVRSAGKDAWLCRPAPHVPELDGPEDEDSQGPATTLPPALPDSAGAGVGNLLAAGVAGGSASGDPLVAWDYRQTATVLRRRRTSFRSIREAVTAARDGDRIVLRRGIHNGMGESVTLTKRVLIEGEGQLGEATIDQRANCPMFRIKRGGVVLRNIELDQTGFRDALLVDGPSSVHPLISGCTIKCSGDDAVNVGGAASPTFLRCLITAKKVGLKAWGSSAPRLEQCLVQKCGEQGLRVQESAAPLLHGCVIEDCKEEAAVAADSACLTLLACMLRRCKGPGVDLSGTARAEIRGGSVAQCVGGVWAWERARVALAGATVAGGPSHALLADGEARLEVRESRVHGTVHATEAAWAGILHPSNSMDGPDQPTDFPPEEGPFRFVPDRFTRKQ